MLLQRVGFRPALGRVRDVLALVVLAAVLSTTIAATNGVTTLWLSGDVAGDDYASEWLLWWTGDAMGVLLVAPLLFVLATTGLDELRGRRRRLEAGVLLALLVAAAATVSIGGYWRYRTCSSRSSSGRPSASASSAPSSAASSLQRSPSPAGSPARCRSEASTTEIVQILEGLLAGVAISL